MPTDLPPDYKPAPPRDGADSRDPGAAPVPGGPATPGDIGGDVVDGRPGMGVPQPGPAGGPGIPGSPGGDVVDPGIPGTAPAI